MKVPGSFEWKKIIWYSIAFIVFDMVVYNSLVEPMNGEGSKEDTGADHAAPQSNPCDSTMTSLDTLIAPTLE